jgi:hypothetical protein
MEGGRQDLICGLVPRVTDKTMNARRIFFQTEIRTGKARNLSQKRYCWSQLLGFYEMSYSFTVVSVRSWLPLQVGSILSDFSCDLYSLFSCSIPRFYLLSSNILVRHVLMAVLLCYRKSLFYLYRPLIIKPNVPIRRLHLRTHYLYVER